jgi:CubicO group peptidase (beta-lactamase class C family)
MDSAALEGARAYAFTPERHTQGVVVTRRGSLVAEWYAEGRGPDSYAASWSMGKSFTSALVGIAIDEGKIPSTDVALGDYYPQWTDGRAAMKLDHVLHMASGLEWLEAYDFDNANGSNVVQLVLTPDPPLDYVLARPLEVEPGSRFSYSSGDTLLLSGILQQATGMAAGDYAQARIFSKLDITGAEWWKAHTGETLTYCCLDMTSRDYARFGLLYMQRGNWEGEQIIPESWIDATLAPSPQYAGYGYQWWLEGKVDSELPADLFMANGHDGQFIYVIPSLELVVVRNGIYDKFPGPPVADPSLFLRYPSDGLGGEGSGTIGPQTWSHADFLRPILDSIQ